MNHNTGRCTTVLPLIYIQSLQIGFRDMCKLVDDVTVACCGGNVNAGLAILVVVVYDGGTKVMVED